MSKITSELKRTGNATLSVLLGGATGVGVATTVAAVKGHIEMAETAPQGDIGYGFGIFYMGPAMIFTLGSITVGLGYLTKELYCKVKETSNSAIQTARSLGLATLTLSLLAYAGFVNKDTISYRVKQAGTAITLKHNPNEIWYERERYLDELCDKNLLFTLRDGSVIDEIRWSSLHDSDWRVRSLASSMLNSYERFGDFRSVRK